MESFIQNYLTSTNYEDVSEEILERRISPYATLRPGDLAGLLKLHSTVPFAFKRNRNQGDSTSHHKLDAIFERNQLGLSSSESEDDKSDDEHVIEVVFNGADHGHIPAEYTVSGVKKHEMPVIGVCIDKRICPGFRYRVRKVGSDYLLWNGQARNLESIGMGYGRRLTFTGDMLNHNDCYFWSDSEPDGFAFSIEAVEESQKLIIQDLDENVLGEAVIEKIHEPQEEVDMRCEKGGVTKRVRVTMTCCVTYYQRHNFGLMELMAHVDQETISGEAILVKPRSARKSSLVAVDKLFLPRIGHCKFVPDC